MVRSRFSRQSTRERRYNTTQAVRAIALALVVAPVFIALLYWAGMQGTPTKPEQKGWALVPQFSPRATPQQLSKAFKEVSALVDARFIERDKVEQMLARLKKEYKEGTLVSKAQLDQALVDFLATLNDRYATVMSTQAYNDLMVQMSGQEVGIELNFTVDGTTGNWVVQQMPPDGPAAKAGIQVGDVLISVEGYHIEELKRIGPPGQLIQFLLTQAGNLGSKAKLTLRRGVDVYDFEVERTVIKTNPAFIIPDNQFAGDEEEMMMMEMGGGFPGGMENGQLIKINHMESATLIAEFEMALNKLIEDGVKGVILDLSNVVGGNGDTAIQLAALFIDKGVIAHVIRPIDKDAVEMKTYTAHEGKVYVTTRGPFRKDKDGKLLTTEKDVKETTEALPWKSNVFKGEVVVGVNGNTIGAAELVAAALQKTRHAVVVGTDITFGKGMSVTYYPVTPDHVVRFSTAVYLQPDGASIDNRGVMPNVGVEEFQYGMALMQVLQQRMRIVPFPIQPEKEKKEENNQVRWFKW